MAKQFLFVYRDTVGSKSAAMPSPEQMQELLARWGAWIEKFMKTGQMVSPGDALHPTGKVLKSTGVVTDGPFMEAKELLGGYSIVKADSYEQALAIARECPAHHDGSSIEVRELAGLAG
ncbi:MAG TPA: YciI family protein [Gemmatales bacterium]|nr:YciI family protein [Gemmatales bacterium]